MNETGETILIVDDDDDLSGFLILILKGFGFVPHAEPNVRLAKQWLAANPRVCLILSDVMMPDGNGLDFCRWVRAEPNLEKVPIILCTGLQDEETMNDALELWAVDFIYKPVTMATLKEKIDRLRRRSSPE